MHSRRFWFGASLAFLSGLPGLTARADASAGERLGQVQFAVTGQPAAQDHVVRGVKLLHHMMYPEADRAFAAAVAADPSCALGYWGRAMTLLHPLWPDAPTAAELREGEAFVKQGLALPPATPRERAYLETIGRYFAGAQPEQSSIENVKCLPEVATPGRLGHQPSVKAFCLRERSGCWSPVPRFHVLPPARYRPHRRCYDRLRGRRAADVADAQGTPGV